MESPVKYFAHIDDFRQLGKVKHKLVDIEEIVISSFEFLVIPVLQFNNMLLSKDKCNFTNLKAGISSFKYG